MYFNVAALTTEGQYPTLARSQTPALSSPLWRSSPPPSPPISPLSSLHCDIGVGSGKLIDDQHIKAPPELRMAATPTAIYCKRVLSDTSHSSNKPYVLCRTCMAEKSTVTIENMTRTCGCNV